MSLIGPGKGLIVDLSCFPQSLSPTIDQPLPYRIEQLLMMMMRIMMMMRLGLVVNGQALQTKPLRLQQQLRNYVDVDSWFFFSQTQTLCSRLLAGGSHGVFVCRSQFSWLCAR